MYNNLSYNLPWLKAGWKWVKLGDFAESEKGKKPKQLQQNKDKKFSIPYVDIKAFEKREIDNYTDGENCRLCGTEDVLIVWDGARCGLVGRGISGAIGSTLAKIKSKVHNNSFLFYFLQMNYKLINSNPKGVGIPHIEPNLFWNLQIPLPPLDEQKKIVEKIEELFSQLDSGVSALKKAKEQIRLYRQSVLASAFSGKLVREAGSKQTAVGKTEMLNEAEPKAEYKNNKLPDGWKWVKLGDITNNFDGQRIPLSKEVRSKRKGEYRYYGATGVIDYIDDFIFAGTYLLIGEDGANLLSRTRPLSFIVEGKFWVNNHAHVLQPKNGLNIKYLNYYFNSITLESYITGSAQPKLTQKNLNKIPVPYVFLDEQKKIVSEIEKRFSEADNLEKSIDESLAKAESLRQSILKQAFEGKLV